MTSFRLASIMATSITKDAKDANYPANLGTPPAHLSAVEYTGGLLNHLTTVRTCRVAAGNCLILDLLHCVK